MAGSGATDWNAVPTDLGKHLPGMPDTGFARGFMAIAPVIVAAIRSGRTEVEHAATFTDGLRVQKVLDAARVSNESGMSISIS